MEEEKKAIENLEKLSHYCSLRAIDIEEENSNLWANFCVSIQRVENLIEKQQAEIEKKDICLKACEKSLIEERTERIKKDKIINKMAEDIVLLREAGWLTNINNKQDAIKYYTKLVEEEK